MRAIAAARYNIQLIHTWTGERSLDELKTDTLVRYAIERAFIAIDSSIKDVPADLLARHGVPAGMIAGFGRSDFEPDFRDTRGMEQRFSNPCRARLSLSPGFHPQRSAGGALSGEEACHDWMETDGHSDAHVHSNWMELDKNTDAPINAATLKITPDILGRIAELDEFKGAWRAFGRLAPERLSSLRRIATIESIGSSTRIEGAKLSNREVERLLSNLDIKSFANRDEEVVAGYADIMETIFENWEEIDLTESHIRQLHRDLLKYSTKDDRHRGAYKTLPNHVEAFGPDGKSLGVVFETATPFDTPRLMGELVVWTQGVLREKALHPLLVIAIFIVMFLAIHPFQDGNGRLSRALTTLLLLRAGYHHVPYSSLESIIEHSKDSYYLALRRTQGTIKSTKPDWQPWMLYFLTALKRQKDQLAEKIDAERSVFGKLPELSIKILELARKHGRVTIADAAKATGVSRNTIKDHIVTRTKSGELVRHGAGRGTWYALA